MHFGSEAIFTEDGLIVNSGMTSALGIRDGSRCWGTWVSDARGTSLPPHFLISPIPPRCWLRAFRIDLKIEHKKGAMHKAAAALSDHMNILFAECAPSGHHHATWNIVAEITSGGLLEESQRVRKDLERHSIRPSESAVRQTLDTYVNQHVTRAIEAVEEAVGQADARPAGGFLYQKSRQSLLYETAEEEEDKKKTRYSDIAGGRYVIRVNWMETLAVFMAYSKLAPDMFVRFVYDEKNASFRSEGIPSFAGTMGKYVQELAGRLPTTTIVSLDVYDRTIRASLSREDIDRQKVSVKIPYRITRREVGGGEGDGRDHGSQGLLEELCALFSDMNLLQVTNQIANYEEEERGILNFLASPENGQFDHIVSRAPGSPEQIEAIDGLKTAIKGIKTKRGSGSVLSPIVAVHDTFQLFVSTKQFLWKRRRDIYPQLQSLAGRYGFQITRVSDDDIVRTYDGRTGDHHINDQVIRRVERCNAILQLWPRASAEEDEDVYPWLHWELGLALGLKKLAILCFDTVGHGEVPDWARKAPQTRGLYHHEFDSGVDAEQIMEALEPGIAYAAGILRSQRPASS